MELVEYLWNTYGTTPCQHHSNTVAVRCVQDTRKQVGAAGFSGKTFGVTVESDIW